MRRVAALAAVGVAVATSMVAAVVPASAHIAATPSAPSVVHRVIGHGTPASCTSAAVVRAVAKGGDITFSCGPKPVVIAMKATAKVTNTSHRIVLDGDGMVTLDGGGEHQILYLNTCDQSRVWTTSHCQDQEWPQLLVKGMTFAHGYAATKQTASSLGGGGAIFATGGRLAVIDSHFVDNRCYRVGPDLGGAAIRAFEQWHNLPVVISHDTFHGGRCSNGSALSSIGVSWVVRDTVMTDNRATGRGANPASSGSPGGGSGGAIYTDGDRYTVTIVHSVIRNNRAREGGGAVFFVSDDNTGSLTIKHSTLESNPSDGFWTRPYPGIFYQSTGHPLKVVDSTIR